MKNDAEGDLAVTSIRNADGRRKLEGCVNKIRF